ncbi:MAG: phosphonoacetaldehyde hydrolase [Desulfobacterales bacterium]|jgi:phosphonoacetaldehyde hydrolase|nr:phosphonoacetaldehyde hydrolase [Desulfobacterales bacterium]
MTTAFRKPPYTGPLRAVVLDWAGTAVDYGCLGPAAVFVEVFKRFGVTVAMAEARRFMGLKKIDHIRSMCRLPAVVAAWRSAHGRAPDESDVAALYAETEPLMVSAIAGHAEPIPGLLPFVQALREKNIKIGSSTGYTRPMMEVLVPEARRRGYVPDAVVTSSDVPEGRPCPWMCYLNAVELRVYPMQAMVKIGDTPSDIHEGLNAGMWTIGLTKSGNLLGLAAEACDRLEPTELSRRLGSAERELKAAGAHYTAEGVWAVLPIIEEVTTRLAAGEQP